MAPIPADGEMPFHAVPRLDAADRIWLIPLPVAKWLAVGGLSGPIANSVVASAEGITQAQAWDLPLVWLVWALGLGTALLGAFVRPGGLHAGRWATVIVDYLLAPRRATWRPVKA